jgi:invasion protein IalB
VKIRLFSRLCGAKSRFNINQGKMRILKIRSICQMALAATVLAALSGAVLAQDTTQNQEQTPLPPKGLGPRKAAPPPAGAPADAPKVETVSTHGKWQIQCSEAPAQNGQPAGKACGMVQVGKSDKNENIGISLIINKIKQGDKSQTLMRALVPIGVYLPTGIAMEIDGAALEGRMNFTRCTPRACEGFGEASDATLKKFLKGKVATFYIYDRPGNGYPIKIPLTGFAEGLTELGKM